MCLKNDGSDRRDTTQQQQNSRIEISARGLNSTRRRQDQDQDQDGKILMAHLKQESG